jgi:hypothetical protein
MNDDAWDYICVNPHESHLVEGRKEGHVAGLKKGYDDGLDLGCNKGVKFGIEVGFLRKSCELLAAKDKGGQSAPKIHDILRLLNAFPRPDMLFHQHGNENIDLHNELQRIRAKFKVLTTQLKIPQYSLKRVLTQDNESSHSTEW